MSEQEPEPETKQDQLAEDAADLILEADDQLRQNRQEQQEFLDTVAEEEGAEVLETSCNLIGDYTVDLRAQLNGELMDKMGRIDDRLERIQSNDARAYEISDTADEVSQLLADVIDDSEWRKDTFYQAYRENGLDPLGVMLERAFESLKTEKERREGTADGFQQK